MQTDYYKKIRTSFLTAHVGFYWVSFPFLPVSWKMQYFGLSIGVMFILAAFLIKWEGD